MAICEMSWFIRLLPKTIELFERAIFDVKLHCIDIEVGDHDSCLTAVGRDEEYLTN